LLRAAGVAALGAALSFAALKVGAAQQVSASVDLAAAQVEYDGFLPSLAASISPAVRFTDTNVSLAVRGTWLAFQSGNSSIQGLFAASLYTDPLGRFRGEFSGTAGTSAYEEFAQFAHGLARARLHYGVRDQGAWISLTLGRTMLGEGSRSVRSYAFGTWIGQRDRNLTIALSATRVGDTSYTDIEGTGFWQRRTFELEGSLGARGGRGGGQGVYGEAAATLYLSRKAGLTVAAGRYPTDPTRGSVSGRYFSLGIRLASFYARRDPRIDPALPSYPSVTAASAVGTDGHLAGAEIGLESTPHGRRLVVMAPRATSVEIMGDFTDWQPVALVFAGGKWQFAGPLPSGLRRFNVRVDGGPWSVPLGATVVQDDFDQTVGTLVVP
jgi:hypothetical protein